MITIIKSNYKKKISEDFSISLRRNMKKITTTKSVKQLRKTMNRNKESVRIFEMEETAVGTSILSC